MKTLIYLFMLLSVSLLFSQKIIWEKTDFQTDRDLWYSDIVKSSNSNVIYILGCNFNIGDSSFTLVKIDENFDISWVKSFAYYDQSPISPRVSEIGLLFPDNSDNINFISYQNRIEDSGNNNYLYFCKTSADGSYSKEFTDTTLLTNYISTVHYNLLPNDTIMAFVNELYNKSDKRIFLRKFSSSGMSFQKSYVEIDTSQTTAYTNQNLSDNGNLLALGFNHNFFSSSSNYYGNIQFYKFDENFKIQTMKTFSTPFNYSIITNDMKRDLNGNYIFSYHQYDTSIYHSVKSIIMIIDSDGNLIKSLTVNKDEINTIDVIQPTQDGGIIFGGYIAKYKEVAFGHVDENQMKNYIFKLDKDYNFVWDFEIGEYGYYNYLQKVIELSDGTFLVAGNHSDRMYLAKIQPPGTSVENTIFEKDVKVYPNPITGSSVLTLDVPDAGAYTISITDMLGITRTLYENKYLESGENVLMDAHFASAPGAYFINIINAAGERVSKKVAVE